MAVTAAWAALIIAAFLWEFCCRLAAHRWASLVDLAAVAARRRVGLLLVVAIWAFVGVHVFARYSLPR